MKNRDRGYSSSTAVKEGDSRERHRMVNDFDEEFSDNNDLDLDFFEDDFNDDFEFEELDGDISAKKSDIKNKKSKSDKNTNKNINNINVNKKDSSNKTDSKEEEKVEEKKTYTYDPDDLKGLFDDDDISEEKVVEDKKEDVSSEYTKEKFLEGYKEKIGNKAEESNIFINKVTVEESSSEEDDILDKPLNPYTKAAREMEEKKLDEDVYSYRKLFVKKEGQYGITDDNGNEIETENEDEEIESYVVSSRGMSSREYEKAYEKYNDKDFARKEKDILRDYPDNELPIIELYRTCKTYPQGNEALKNVNFRIDKGEFVFIVGTSGSGKSTLIRLLLRDIKPTSGRVYVNGRELTRLPKHKISKFRRSIGVVFQDFKLLKDRNVYENVAFAMRVVGKTQKEIRRMVPHILTIVGLGDKQYALPSELSGGEQQRVALARALVNKPAILLADEPTGNLDPKTAWEIMDLLAEINRQGTTVIVVTHNVDIVDRMKKRVISIKDGVIVSDEQKGGYSYED